MTRQTRTVRADLAAQSADNSPERERVRHAWRIIATSAFAKGISPQERAALKKAGDIIGVARETHTREISQEDEMKKGIGTAIGLAGNRLEGQLSESRIDGVIEIARAMQAHDYEGAIAAMHNWHVSSGEHEIATLLAAATLKPPAPEDRDEASCSNYLESVRNIIRTYSHQLWDFYPNIRERIIEHAKGMLRD